MKSKRGERKWFTFTPNISLIVSCMPHLMRLINKQIFHFLYHCFLLSLCLLACPSTSTFRLIANQIVLQFTMDHHEASLSNHHHPRGKFRLEDNLTGDSRYLNNRHLIKRRVIIGSICVIVFTLGILLGAFSSRTINRSNADAEVGICRFSSTGNMTGTLRVERRLNYFNVSGTVKSQANPHHIQIEQTGDLEICFGEIVSNGEVIPIKGSNNTSVSWNSNKSDEAGSYLLGRVLKMCDPSSCSCCIVARVD